MTTNQPMYKPMTEAEFSKRLEAIAQEARQKTVKLVHEAMESRGFDPLEDNRLPFAGTSEYTTWEQGADNLATLGGWVYDRVHGRGRDHKQSMTRKIRRALGYSYP